MKRICLYDTETNGVNPHENKVVEVACILYDLEHHAPIMTYASLITQSSNPAADINCIPETLLKSLEIVESSVWQRVDNMFVAADVVVAHGADFDKRFTPALIAKRKPWACSMRDIAWPDYPQGKTLMATAVAHGVPVVNAHRALSDVDLMMRLFQRVAERGIDVVELIEKAMAKRVVVKALVSFEQKELAKQAGFSWDGEQKRWWKRMLAEDAKKTKFAFKTQVVES